MFLVNFDTSRGIFEAFARLYIFNLRSTLNETQKSSHTTFHEVAINLTVAATPPLVCPTEDNLPPTEHILCTSSIFHVYGQTPLRIRQTLHWFRGSLRKASEHLSMHPGVQFFDREQSDPPLVPGKGRRWRPTSLSTRFQVHGSDNEMRCHYSYVCTLFTVGNLL